MKTILNSVVSGTIAPSSTRSSIKRRKYGTARIMSASIIPEKNDIKDVVSTEGDQFKVSRKAYQELMSPDTVLNSGKIRSFYRKESKVSCFSSEDFGPQRWLPSGEKLYQCDSEGFWITDNGEVFSEEFDSESILCYPPHYDEDGLPPKVRKELNSSEESWLHCHEHLLEPELVQEEEVISSQFSEEIEIKEGIMPSSDNTELPKVVQNIWGLGNSRSSVIWSAIRYSRDKAIARVVKYKDLLTEEELEWLREILGDKDITISRRHMAQIETSKKLVKNWDRPICSTPIISVPIVHLHIYPSQPKYGIKEGMVYCLIIHNGKIVSEYEKRSFNNEDLKQITTKAVERAASRGWKVKVTDMNQYWLQNYNTAPKYTKVRELWNNKINYMNNVITLIK